MSQVSSEFLGNMVTLVSSIGGPFSRTVDALTVNFNPTTDVEVWVDGIQVQVKSFLYDADTATYQLYLGILLTADNVIQVIHHMPNPPFTSGTTLYGFAVIPDSGHSVMTLSAILEVTAPFPGDFSVTHGLVNPPYLIEIIPTIPESDPPGTIWAQVDFADETNIYLVGSDTGVTATVLVYTQSNQNSVVQVAAKTLLVSSPSPGDFSIPHLLGAVPSMIEILPTSGSILWAQSPAYDGTNIYLSASEEGVTAVISMYGPASFSLNLACPAIVFEIISETPGEFSLPHFLSSVPSRIEILMLSSGLVWAQLPAFDESNVYLEASDMGITAKILVYS